MDLPDPDGRDDLPPAPGRGEGALSRGPGEDARARVAALRGRVISDRYRIVEPIAMGGMGAVFLGEHVHMRKRIAIKVLHPETEGLPELAARFEREAIAGAHVDHPNVASATDYGELEDGGCFLVLEYVPGVPLSRLLDRGPMDPARAARIVRQVALGLGAAHATGVIHRDVKPQNVMVVEAGTAGEAEDVAKLIDFGFAKVDVTSANPRPSAAHDDEEGWKRLTLTGTVFGTIAYLAPEAAAGMDAVDARSDLYALGLIFYELLAGRHPFDGTDPIELFEQQRTAVPAPIAQRSPGTRVPPALEAVVMRLLEKNPAARYQSGAELARAIDEALVAAPRAASDAAVALSALRLPVRIRGGSPAERRRALALAFATPVALIFALAVGVVLVTRPEAKSAPPLARGLLAAARSSAERLTPPARKIDGIDAAGWREKMRAAIRSKQWGAGARALVALADLDPDAFRDPEIQTGSGSIASWTALEGGDVAAAVFTTLSRRTGQAGLDVLVDMVETRQGSKGAMRALALLRDPEVLARATPAARIAFELRAASCDDKPALFGRAAQEGDARALAVLRSLESARCRPGCCLRKDEDLKSAIDALEAKFGG